MTLFPQIYILIIQATDVQAATDTFVKILSSLVDKHVLRPVAGER